MALDLTRGKLLGEEQKDKFTLIDVILLILMLVLLANIFIQSVWLAPVKVSGTSMLQTLENDDWLYMDKLKTPERGDVVVFKRNEKENYVKRIIALPGDSVKTVNGKVMVKKGKDGNWQTLYEPYAYYESGKLSGTYIPFTGADIPETVLGDDEMFVLGDNRWGSKDSREIGPVKMDTIIGVVPEWSIKYKEKYATYLDFIERINLRIKEIFKK